MQRNCSLLHLDERFVVTNDARSILEAEVLLSVLSVYQSVALITRLWFSTVPCSTRQTVVVGTLNESEGAERDVDEFPHVRFP